jgi:predicted amidohydrolase YtcJ
MARTADLVPRNGRISTGDPARPEVGALAVFAGRITAVGDEGDIAALIGPGTRMVDALGIASSQDSTTRTSTSSAEA